MTSEVSTAVRLTVSDSPMIDMSSGSPDARRPIAIVKGVSMSMLAWPSGREGLSGAVSLPDNRGLVLGKRGAAGAVDHPVDLAGEARRFGRMQEAADLGGAAV